MNRKNTTLFLSLLLSLPLVAQQRESAFNYLLQKPRVAKRFPDKKLGDHLFLEAGGGMLFAKGRHMDNAKPMGSFAIGDMLTPEHGVRLSFEGSLVQGTQTLCHGYSVALDYMMNLSAVGSRQYAAPRPFEVYGVAGAEYQWSHARGGNASVGGVRFGLRGQVHFSPSTYFYVEPRVGVYTRHYLRENTLDRHHPTASVLAGFGYRLGYPSQGAVSSGFARHSFWDNTFLSMGGGMSLLRNGDGFSWRRHHGEQFSLSAGKWLDPVSGLRLGLKSQSLRQDGHYGVRAATLSADYMLNLHNAFGGFLPQRHFWINAVAGASVTQTFNRRNKKMVPGAGAGLQANLRLSPSAELFLEPRVDVYGKHLAPYANVSQDIDPVLSLTAGLTFHRPYVGGKDLATTPFGRNALDRKLFYEAGWGLIIPVSNRRVAHPKGYLRPVYHIAAGQWLSRASGWRLWADYGGIRAEGNPKFGTLGMDYMLNLSGLVCGYNPQRRLDIIAAAGINASSLTRGLHPRFGGQASLRALVHAGPRVAFYVEPELRVYGSNYIRPSFSSFRPNALASLMAGVQIKTGGNTSSAQRTLYKDMPRRNFFSLAGGLGLTREKSTDTGRGNFLGRMSFGRWYSPLSAWRVSVQGQIRRSGGSYYGKPSLAADYMMDLRTLLAGYSGEKPLNVRALVGLGAGEGFEGKRLKFAADGHVGLQFAAALSPALELYVEPQVVCDFGSLPASAKNRVMPVAFVGMNYRYGKGGHSSRPSLGQNGRQFVFLSLGALASTETWPQRPKTKDRVMPDISFGYGRWENHLIGWQLGADYHKLRSHRHGDVSVWTAQLDGLVDMVALLSGEDTSHDLFRLSALGGVQLGMGKEKGRKAAYAVGARIGLQGGVRIGSAMELYLEPAADIMGRRFVSRPLHRAVCDLKLSVGSKVYF